MSDFSKLFNKNSDPDDPSANMNPMPVDIAPDNSNKLAAYSKALDVNDPKAQLKQYFDNMIANQNTAGNIAAKGITATPEEQAQFEQIEPNPLTRAAMTGGVIGGIKNIAEEAPSASIQAFQKMKDMLNRSGGISERLQSPLSGVINKLAANEPRMLQAKDQINQLILEKGYNSPDVLALTQKYNNLLKP